MDTVMTQTLRINKYKYESNMTQIKVFLYWNFLINTIIIN